MKTTLFSSVIGDIGVDLAFVNNLEATTDPTTSSDSSQGYQAGSTWINTTAKRSFTCVSAAVGAAQWNETGFSGTPGQVTAPAASTGTGAGGDALLQGGAGGSTSGSGGASKVTGGAGSGGNANGGSTVLTGGAANGSGVNGGVRVESIFIRNIAAPTAKTVSATLTAAELLALMITVTQGSGAPSAQQLPTGTAIQAALPGDFAVGDSFDFSVINLGGASEVASITVNTDVTIVGNAAIPVPATGVQSSGLFRARKTADHVFVVYRIA